jgi:hypothetical protein
VAHEIRRSITNYQGPVAYAILKTPRQKAETFYRTSTSGTISSAALSSPTVSGGGYETFE